MMRFSIPAVLVLFLPVSCGPPESPPLGSDPPRSLSQPVRTVSTHPLVAAARGRVGRTVRYDPAYVRLAYPGGDVPDDRGVCTDVVVRALRAAFGIDLQVAVHRDMKRAFRAYPALWGLSRPDRNIDHRRVPNLRCFFRRRGWSVPSREGCRDVRPGDLVTGTVGRNRPHIVIVSDRRSPGGEPWILHNIGWGTVEETGLSSLAITGHYRVPR